MAKYKIVTLKEIAANNFSLSPKDYIDEVRENLHDLETCDECIVSRERGDMDATGYKEEKNDEC